MVNYFKYLPTSLEDESWGLYVLNAGCNHIIKNDHYPSRQHPMHHYFDWQKGRILDEFQIIYISRGEGIFESTSVGQRAVHEGTILFLFPGEWHRFRPDPDTVWDEFWVGCNGVIVQNLVQQKFFDPLTPLLSIGAREDVLGLLSDIIENTKEEKTGYQPVAAGITLHLLGKIHSIVRQRSLQSEGNTECIINRARLMFRMNVDENISMEKVAEELNVGYAWFRKAFKTYTGMAPHQYMLQLKIEKAKMMLGDQSKSIKEIGFDLHFESPFYFSKLFKEKTGFSPEQFRKSMIR